MPTTFTRSRDSGGGGDSHLRAIAALAPGFEHKHCVSPGQRRGPAPTSAEGGGSGGGRGGAEGRRRRLRRRPG